MKYYGIEIKKGTDLCFTTQRAINLYAHRNFTIGKVYHVKRIDIDALSVEVVDDNGEPRFIDLREDRFYPVDAYINNRTRFILKMTGQHPYA